MRISVSFRHLLIRNGVYCSKTVCSNKLQEFFFLVRPCPIVQKLIRIGAPNDGGYLLPDDLNGINACFSPGVGQLTNFEEDLSQLGIPSYLADGSIDSIPSSNKMFHFTNKFLNDSNSSSSIRLQDWIISTLGNNQSDLILQMDIEGSEYSVIFDTPEEVLNKFRIMVIEFHNMDLLISEGGFDLIRSAFYKILSNFTVVHIHPNNHKKFYTFRDFTIPPVLEFTFVNKNRIQPVIEDGVIQHQILSYPHELDAPNIPRRADYVLPKCWYRNI